MPKFGCWTRTERFKSLIPVDDFQKDYEVLGRGIRLIHPKIALIIHEKLLWLETILAILITKNATPGKRPWTLKTESRKKQPAAKATVHLTTE